MTETTKTQPTKKPWYKTWWVWAIIIAVIIAYGATNAAKGDTPDETPAAEAPAVLAEKPVTKEPVAKEPKVIAPSTTSEDINAALLAAFGTDNYQSLPSDMWSFYIANVEAVNNSLARITLQVTNDDPIAEGSSRAAFSLIGAQFPDLQFMEVVDGAGVHIEQTHRRDVPLLNQ